MQSIAPEFNSSLLYGLLAKPIICRPIIQIGISKLTKLFIDKHPRVIKKMSQFSPSRMVLVPLDMPFDFFVEFSNESLQINIIDKNTYLGKNLTKITASIDVFVKMLEGNLDGDALFFSRKLIIEGETTIIVALRNILEAENVNIKNDIKKSLGIFYPAFTFLNNIFLTLKNELDQNLGVVKSSMVENIEQQISSQKREHNQLKDKLTKLGKQANLTSTKIKSLRDKINTKDIS